MDSESLPSGALVTVRINSVVVTGYWLADVGGYSWLLQPHRWIRITKPENVRIVV